MAKDFQSQRAAARAGAFKGGRVPGDSFQAGMKSSDKTAPNVDVKSGLKSTPMGKQKASNQPWSLDQKVKRRWTS